MKTGIDGTSSEGSHYQGGCAFSTPNCWLCIIVGHQWDADSGSGGATGRSDNPTLLPSKHRAGRGLREEGRPLRAASPPACTEEAHLQNRTIKLSEPNRSAADRSHHEAEAEAPEPRAGWANSHPQRPGEDGEGRGRGQTQVGQQGPVPPDLRGLLRGTGERLEVPLLVSEPWRRWAGMDRQTIQTEILKNRLIWPEMFF